MVGPITRLVQRGRTDVVDDLMKLAEGDVDRLQEAIRDASDGAELAELEDVVAELVRRRSERRGQAA